MGVTGFGLGTGAASLEKLSTASSIICTVIILVTCDFVASVCFQLSWFESVCLFVCFSHRTGSESIKGRLPGLFVLPCSGQLQTQSEWHLFLLLSSGLWETKWRNRPAEISAFVSRSFWASDKREGKGQIWQMEQNISLSAFTSYFLLLPKSMSSYSLVRIYRGFF